MGPPLFSINSHLQVTLCTTVPALLGQVGIHEVPYVSQQRPLAASHFLMLLLVVLHLLLKDKSVFVHVQFSALV